MSVVDDLIQESRTRMKCKCVGQRFGEGTERWPYVIEWQNCPYHMGMRDALSDRAVMLRALEAKQIGWQRADGGLGLECRCINPPGDKCRPVYLIPGEPTNA